MSPIVGLGEFMKVELRLTSVRKFSRIIHFSLPLLAAMTLFSVAASAQTVDEVIAKNIQAKGGVDKLKSVRSLRTTAKFIQGLAQVQAYDGKTGWQISPFGGRKDPELLSQDDSKSLVVDADIDGPLVDYKEKGHKAELVGHDSMEGTDCFKIKLSMK